MSQIVEERKLKKRKVCYGNCVRDCEIKKICNKEDGLCFFLPVN